MSSTPSFGPVAVIGVGARTPVGTAAPNVAAAIRAGISRLREHPYMLDKAGEPYSVAMDRTIDAHDRLERLFLLASSAADEALNELAIRPETRVPVYLAMPEANAFFDRRAADQVTARLSEHLRPRCRAHIEPLLTGNAAGLMAVSRAMQVLASDSVEFALVVGVDSHIDPDWLEHLDEAGRIISASNRWGFPPGEGAGALLFSRPEIARGVGRAILAEVKGVGTAQEANLIATDSVCVGIGLTRALEQALSTNNGGRAHSVYCDLNGERYRTSEYTYSLLRLGPLIDNPTAYVAPADAWGDVGAATGPLLAGLAIASAQRGYAKGNSALVWASSESGLRSAAVFELTANRRVR